MLGRKAVLQLNLSTTILVYNIVYVYEVFSGIHEKVYFCDRRKLTDFVNEAVY